MGERMSPPVMATNCAVRTRRLGSGEAMAPYTYSTHYSSPALVIHVKTLKFTVIKTRFIEYKTEIKHQFVLLHFKRQM